jgi:hypothetical protein
VTAAGGRDALGVGLCLGTAGAVIAVARQYPLRLAAVATVTWPVPAGTPDWVPPRCAELMARAALAQGWVIAADRAAMLRAATYLAVTPELAAATASVEADLAVGAAIATLLPPDPGRGGPATAGTAVYPPHVGGTAAYPTHGAGAAAYPPHVGGTAVYPAHGAGAAAYPAHGAGAVAYPAHGAGAAAYPPHSETRLDIDGAGISGASGWAVQRIGDTAGTPVNGVSWYDRPAGSHPTRPW